MDNIKTEKIRVKDGDIIVGIPLPWNVFDNDEVLLLRKGQVIESEKQLKTLIERGLLVNQYEIESVARIVEEYSAPFELIDDVQSRLEEIFNSIKKEVTTNFPIEILNLCKMLQQACDKDMSASIFTIFMGSNHIYTVRHPVHVAVLCEVISKQLKWIDNERLSLLAAALTSNIAMIDLQEQLCSQKGPLGIQQKLQVRSHPERGVEMLRKASVTNQDWLNGVLHHHESVDGNGYPFGLTEYGISKHARIIAAGDIYCAAVSSRSYRRALSPDEAMRGIYLGSNKHIKANIANICVSLIGVYPPGTFVRLVNNEIALVTRCGEKAHIPIVHSVVGADGKFLPKPVKRDCNKKEFAIKEAIEKDQVDVEIDPCQLLGYCD